MENDKTADDNGAGNGTQNAGPSRIPPYISFQTLLTFFSELKTNGLPTQIDKSVLRRFSGGIQNQLKMAVRSLGLVDVDRPTPKLHAMVDAFETPKFEPLLLDLLKETYPYIFELDLMSATPTMFADAFKATGAKEDVSRKCRSFFLHAAKRAGVPMGQRILSGSVPRKTTNGSVKRKPKAIKPPVAPPSPIGGVHDKPKHDDKPEASIVAQLLTKFPEFDPEWSEEIKVKWFAGFEKFMATVKT